MTMHEGVTHPPPNIPWGTDPAHTPTRAEIISLIDDRIRQYDGERRRQDSETDKSKFKQKVLTYGVGGVGGLVLGVGSTILIQKLKRGKGPGSMKP